MNPHFRAIVKVCVILVVVAAAAAGGYFAYRQTLPCARPIEYRIGAVDPRFGVSTSSLVADAQQATALWSNAAGKPLFAYAPDGALTVNLVYDSRQAQTLLEKNISAKQGQNEDQKAQLETDQSQLETAEQQYESQVQYWNARGGAPPAAYQELQAQKQQLDAQEQTLSAQIAALNADISQTNAQVDTYNSTAQTDFNEGEYIEDAAGKRIEIYSFADQNQLTRVLAHEFGHALGLGHDQDPNAIMYPYNQSTALALAPADVSELDAECHLK